MYRHCNDCPEFFEGSNPPYYWSIVPHEHDRQWEGEDRYRCETCTKINQVTKLVSSLERDLISSKRILDGLIDDRDRKKAKK
jgi:hypothetical protein